MKNQMKNKMQEPESSLELLKNEALSTIETVGESIESVAEAIANSITHGFGAILSVSALVTLIVIAAIHDNTLKIISSVLYGSSLVVMYSASTLYHSISQRKLKYYFRLLDHTAIYLLIAGTYTPYTLVTLKGAWGWSLFGIVWGLAIFGIAFKLIFRHRYEILSTIIYLLMGWVGIIAAKPIWSVLSGPAITWIVVGGLAYTFGVIFYIWKRPFSHTVWHLFVLLGSACHFFGVLLYVIM